MKYPLYNNVGVVNPKMKTSLGAEKAVKGARKGVYPDP
jgi:hypothetical protein